MNRFKKPPSIQNQIQKNQKILTSLYDVVKSGIEFSSIIEAVSNKKININPIEDIKKCISDIEHIRGRRAILYMPNIVNSKITANISIDYPDDLPFSELISSIPITEKEVDVIFVTPGGSGVQAAKFVEKLRSRFDFVGIILPDMAMSAGTIFAMSGDEIVMTQNSYIGPIDPQVPNRDGRYVPAQAINILLSEIQKRGQLNLDKGKQPEWTDLQILSQLDAKDIGDAINASNFSIELVENYLRNYKFRNWKCHSSGIPVTEKEKEERAKEIAAQLCDHSLWKSHGRGITREQAESVCRLKIIKSEEIALDEIIKKLWAIVYWTFESSSIYKMFISNFYTLIRNDGSLLKQNK